MLSAPLTSAVPARREKDAELGWGVAGAAFLALLLYSCWYLWNHLWDQEAYAHGLIVAAIVIWLCWRVRRPVLDDPLAVPVHAAGWGLLLAGAALYFVGHAVTMPLLHVAALMPVAVGLLLVVGGLPALRAYWFPVLFLLFLIPLPGFVIDHLTGALKWRISWITESLLFTLGYPVARDGVVLTIGQYQLLVADACSGLNSLFSLSAMGLLYLHLMAYRNRLRNLLLLSSIVPIAVVANLVRVVFLVLLTYYAGDETAQGFLHGFAGMFLFLLALSMLFGLDRLLQRVPALREAEAGGTAR